MTDRSMTIFYTNYLNNEVFMLFKHMFYVYNNSDLRNALLISSCIPNTTVPVGTAIYLKDILASLKFKQKAH